MAISFVASCTHKSPSSRSTRQPQGSPQKPLQWFRPALKTLEEIRAKDTVTYLDFLNGVKRRLEAGIAKECMGTFSLSNVGDQGMTDVEVAYALSAPFSAGVDTVCGFR